MITSFEEIKANFLMKKIFVFQLRSLGEKLNKKLLAIKLNISSVFGRFKCVFYTK